MLVRVRQLIAGRPSSKIMAKNVNHILPQALCSERNCTRAGWEMRRIEYLLRLSVLVGLRSPPRLSTPGRPSKKRMTCLVLIFNFCETSAGLKYSASADSCSISTAGSGSVGCCRARILAWARSSRVAFNQSRFPGWSDLSSNDQIQCAVGTMNNWRCQLYGRGTSGCAA